MQSQIQCIKTNPSYKIFIIALLTSIIVFYFSSFAIAQNRFMAMDKNNDKTISLEEFLDANPNLNANAYAIIDINENKSVSYEEWIIFQERHSQPDGLKVEADKITRLPAKTAPDDPINPTKPSAPQSPSMPPMQSMQMPPMQMNTGMPPMKSMFDKNTSEVEQVKEVVVPILEQKSNSLPLLSAPSMQNVKAPNAPIISSPSANDVKAPANANTQSIPSQTEVVNELMPLLMPNLK